MKRAVLICAALTCATAGPAMALGWTSPTGTSGGTGWGSVANARDDNTGTYATHNPQMGWGSYITLSLGSAIYSDRIRVYTDFGGGEVDMVDMDVSEDGSTWTDVWQGAVSNCAWTTKTFTGQNVRYARFRYHRVSTSYIFWLYEFDFYEAPPVIDPPTLTTTAATSVEETTAILHGTVSDDGGEPCSVRFNWGTTAAYGNNTTWVSDKVTGDTIGQLITGLTNGLTYHFRIEATNSGGTSYGSDMTFTTGSPGTGWISPTGHSGSGWEDEVNAYDDETSSLARCYHDIGDAQWGPFLYLTHSSMLADRIRFYAKQGGYIDQVDVDVYDGSSWTDVYQGTYNNKQWQSYSFTEQTVTQARIRFRVNTTGVSLYWELYEFDFHRVVKVNFTGTFDGTTDVTLAVDGSTRGTYTTNSSPYTFSNISVGQGDRILIYYNSGGGTRGAVVTTATGTSPQTLNLTANQLEVRSDGTTSTTNSDINDADNGDTDVPYSGSGSTLTLTAGFALSVPSGQTYAPGGSTTLNSVTLAGTISIPSQSIDVTGSWTNNGGTLSGSGSTVRFTGSSAANVDNGSAQTTFQNLTIAKNAGVNLTASRALNIDGDFQMTSGNFVPGTYAHTCAGDWDSSGGGFASPETGQITFDGSSHSITLGGANNFGRLVYAASGASTLTSAVSTSSYIYVASGTLNMGAGLTHSTGDLLANGGTLDLQSSDVTVNVHTGDNPFYGGLRCASGTLDLGSGTVTVNGVVLSGDLYGALRTGGTVVPGSGTVIMNASAAGYTQELLGFTFNNLEINNSTASGAIIAGATTINNDLSITAAGTLNGNGQTLTVGGDFDNDGAFSHNNCTLVFSGTGALTGTTQTTFGNITVSGSLTAHPTAMTTTGNLTGSGTLSIGTGTVTVNGTYNVSGNTTFTGAGELRLNGGVSSFGTLTPSTGTVYFQSGSVAQSLPSAAYGRVECANTSGSDITLGGNRSVSHLTISAGGLDVAGGQMLTVTTQASLTGTASLELATNSTLRFGPGASLTQTANAVFTAAGTSQQAGGFVTIDASSGSYDMTLNGNVDVNYARFYDLGANGLALAATSTTTIFDNVQFYDGAAGATYYLRVTGAAWDGSDFVGMGFDSVGGTKTRTLQITTGGTVSVNGYASGGSWLSGAPTSSGNVSWGPSAAEGLSSTVKTRRGGNEISWSAEVERRTAGYRVMRRAVEHHRSLLEGESSTSPVPGDRCETFSGAWRKLIDVPATLFGIGPGGSRYRCFDAGAPAEAEYQIDEIETSGHRGQSVRVHPKGAAR